MGAARVGEGPGLDDGERRWLHDKYERLASEEASLADSRTSYFAAIASALVAAFVVLVVNVRGYPLLLTTMTTFLAGFGILISSVWTVVLHRTTAAQTLWREAALRLEADAPPITTPLPASVSISGGGSIPIDLTRPYQAHYRRFVDGPGLRWVDRVNPSGVSANVPLVLVVLWSILIVGTWTWFLLWS